MTEPPAGPGGPVGTPGQPRVTHATGSWHRLMKASLHELPHAVQRSNEHIRALKRLMRSH